MECSHIPSKKRNLLRFILQLKQAKTEMTFDRIAKEELKEAAGTGYRQVKGRTYKMVEKILGKGFTENQR